MGTLPHPWGGCSSDWLFSLKNLSYTRMEWCSVILVDCPIRSPFHFSIQFFSALLFLASSTTYHDTWQAFGLLRAADTCYSCSKQLPYVTTGHMMKTIFQCLTPMQCFYSHFSMVFFSVFAISFSDISGFVHRKTQTVINCSLSAQGKTLTYIYRHITSFPS